MTYQLIDSGEGQKLERFGPYVMVRPCGQAVWNRNQQASWHSDAQFSREGDRAVGWQGHLPPHWEISVEGITFLISPTDFGHLGIFPEQRPMWDWIRRSVKSATPSIGHPPRILNLFAYSGGATLAAAQGGAEVCHVDASKGMVAWAQDNAERNGLAEAPIRWIVDEAGKFLQREVKRGRQYEGIILDPPSFGRGARGEVFKVERDLPPILESCRQLLSDKALFLLFSCHTPGYTPLTLQYLTEQCLGSRLKTLGGTIEVGEMTLTGAGARPLPSGTYAKWQSAALLEVLAS